MIKMLLALEKKGLQRGVKDKTEIVVKVIKTISYVYFSLMFLGLGTLLYDLMLDSFPENNVFYSISTFLIYYFVFEFSFRFYLQKMPTGNLKYLLLQPICKNTIIKYFMGKSFITPLNFIQLLFFIPFVGISISQGYSVLSVLSWSFAIYLVVIALHFLIIIVSSNLKVGFVVISIGVLLGALHYYELYDVTKFTRVIFYAPYQYPVWTLGYLLVTTSLVYLVFHHYKSHLYLDYIEKQEVKIGRSKEYLLLDKLGESAIFIRNDIKLLFRNKRGKSTLLMSLVFLFYGFLLLSWDDVLGYGTYVKYLLVAYMCGGGFIMMFGQFVPGWDSSYFKLYCTSNFNYSQYINAKWILMVCGTLCLVVLSMFYLYFSVELYLTILAVALYNIGVSTFAMLLAGLYNNTPIDLSVNKNIFGEKKAFNLTILLISLPTLLLPLLTFTVGFYIQGFELGLFFVAALGLFGLCLKGKIITFITIKYNKEKYKTLQAFNKI